MTLLGPAPYDDANEDDDEEEDCDGDDDNDMALVTIITCQGITLILRTG